MELKNIKKNKKGNVNFSNFSDMIFQFGLLVIIVGALVLSVSSFKDSQPLGTSFQDNATNQALGNGSLGLLNFSTLFGTNGTLLGVGLLITIVLSTFVIKKNRET